MNLVSKITNYCRAGYPAINIVSHEEQRVEGELLQVLKQLRDSTAKDSKKWQLHAWSVTTGIMRVDIPEKGADNTEEPMFMLAAFDSMKEKTILMLRDFHMMLADPNPILYRKLKDSLLAAKQSNRVVIIVGCKLVLPAELEKLITVLDFELPDRAQLKDLMHEVARNASVAVKKENEDALVDAARGLTTLEAEDAFALSIVEAGELSSDIVRREKENTVKKGGIVEIIRTKNTMADIGGLENLKQDLKEKKILFCDAARDFGLPAPRGYLIVGQAGTGKSLCADAAGNIFDLPQLRCDAGKLFGSLVGQSEANWRSAHATAKAIAPCVFVVNEVDGLFCGAKSSGETDSGVTNRVIKSVLESMQNDSKDIFYVFTANDIDGLPDPLIDRLDTWSVDLPNASERADIWKIHIEKLRDGQTKARSAAKFDVSELSERTQGFSGRQIEQVWLKALNLAFIAGREPKMQDCITAASRFIATATTMAEAINRRRQRLKDRAMSASKEHETVKSGRKLAVNN